jgi:putative beta-barrel porin BBP2
MTGGGPGLGFIPSAWAQPLTAQGEGVNVGRFILHPSVIVDLSRNSNIRFASADLPGTGVIASGVLAVRPRLLVDLPLGQSRIVWSYSPLYRGYTSRDIRSPDAVSHFFDLGGLYRGSRAVTIKVRDHVVRDTVELQELDRGRELIGFVPFSVHEVELEAMLDLGARQGVSLIPRYGLSRFNERGEPSFFSYQKQSLEFRYSYALDPLSSLYGYYNFEQIDQSREESFFGEKDTVARVVGVGLQRTLNQQVVASLVAGYETMRFEGDAGRDFSGPVLDASAGWQLSDTVRLDASVRRQPYQSFFVNNNYYVNQSGILRVTHQIGRSVYWQGGVTYQTNVYADPLDISVAAPPSGTDVTDCDGNPQPDGQIDSLQSYCPSLGRRRRDRALQLEIGAGFHVLRTLRFFVGYNSELRSSNIDQRADGDIGDPFHYRVKRAFFRIEAGWL